MSSSIGTPYHILSECRLKRTGSLSVSDCDHESESTNRLMKRRTWNARCQASKWVKACRVVCVCVAYSHQLTVATVAPFSGNTPQKIVQSLKHGNQHVRIPVQNTDYASESTGSVCSSMWTHPFSLWPPCRTRFQIVKLHMLRKVLEWQLDLILWPRKLSMPMNDR